MELIALIGRVLFASIFLASGVNHLRNADAMAGYAASKKLPWPRLMVLGSGVWIIVAGLMVLFGFWGDLGALMLAGFLVATAFLFHGFWSEQDEMARQNEMIHFTKDIALAGAALLIFVLFGMVTDQAGEQLGLVVTEPLLF